MSELDIDRLFAEHGAAISAAADAVVPADAFASASESGALEFLRRVLRERPEWMDRIRAVAIRAEAPPHDSEKLSRDESESEQDWFEQLVSAGYYADPGNGGNRDGQSWRMIDWAPTPKGGWSRSVPVPMAVPVSIPPDSIADTFDAIVVGSGAGGGTVACGLAESGRRTLVVEAGGWPAAAELSRDHLRNPRVNWGLAPLSGPVDLGNPRVLEVDGGSALVRPTDPAWSNNAFTAGGGTRVYGAQAWRFLPQDFAMASEYGVPEGSSLADWPIGYDDLDEFYSLAEWEVGVSGEPATIAVTGRTLREYPMPPLPETGQRRLLADGATRMGISTVSVPLLINSTARSGRAACEQCGQCIGFACPVDAKNGSQNTMLTRAFATGRCGITLETRAERILTGPNGRVIGVGLVGEQDGKVWRKDVYAEQIVLACGAIESARLLLASSSEAEPNGIGNNADQVGRHLQGHLYGGVLALFADDVDDFVGPGPSIATTDFRHGNTNLVGGGMIANDFVTTPSITYRDAVGAGFIPRAGTESKAGMRSIARRMLRLTGPVQEVTTSSARVRLDPEVVDRFGNRVPRLSGDLHPEDLRARAFLTERAVDWAAAAGAQRLNPYSGTPNRGPSGGQHQAGTCRMGDDPAKSVVDPLGRVWGHDNLHIADASIHVTNGGVNPVLTIFANAIRIVRGMTGEWHSPKSDS